MCPILPVLKHLSPTTTGRYQTHTHMERSVYHVLCVCVGPFSTPLFPHHYVHNLRGVVSEHMKAEYYNTALLERSIMIFCVSKCISHMNTHL